MKILTLLLCLAMSSGLWGRDIVFFATADLQYESNHEKKNHYLVQAMSWFAHNSLWPTDSPYHFVDINSFLSPSETGASDSVYTMSKPRGVIIAGDITGNGRAEDMLGGINEFALFESDFGLTGREPQCSLDFPVYEGFGDKDYRDRNIYFEQKDKFRTKTPVSVRIEKRNPKRPDLTSYVPGGHYSWDWDDVHFVQLNVKASNAWKSHPDEACCEDIGYGALSFLESDLAARVGAHPRPVVIIQHYGLSDSLPEEDPLWTQEERDAFFRILKPYNILAILHGNEPGQGAYTWRGIHVFNVTSQPEGAPEPASHGGYFTVFHITDDYFEAYDVAYPGGHAGPSRCQWASPDIGIHFCRKLKEN